MELQSSRAVARNCWDTGWMPPSPLDGLVADGADFGSIAGREFGAKIFDVVEADELDAGHDGHERFAVFFLRGGGDGAHGAAVEAVLEGEELGADGAAFGAETTGVGASEFERGLPGFGAAVSEEDAVKSADLSETKREFGCVLVEEEVRGMDEAFALLARWRLRPRGGHSRGL